MNAVVAFAILGLLIHQGVAFVRNAFDKRDRVPKAAWILLAWGTGIGLAYGICAFHTLQAYFHLQAPDCAATLLQGLGFGSVAAFWHSVMGYLGAAHPSPNPKGVKLRDERGAIDIVTALVIVFLALIILVVLLKLV